MRKLYIPLVLLFLIFSCKNTNNFKQEDIEDDPSIDNLSKPQDMKESQYITSVRKDNQWYFINENNEVLFDKVFTYASYFSDGLVCVSMDGLRVDGQDKVYGAYYTAMDKNGEFVKEVKSDLPFVFREGRSIISYGPNKILIDKTGEVLKESLLSAYGEYNEGKVPVFRDGNIEYWNKDGDVVIGPAKFTTQGFSERRALVLLDGKYGYIDSKGELIVDYIYDGGSNFKGGFASVKKGDEYFFINSSGEEKLGPFIKTRSFNEGKAAVFTDGAWRFIDDEGQDVFGLSFSETDDFKEGVAVVRKQDGQLALLAENGQIIDSDARVIFQFKNDIAIAEKNGMMGYVNKDASWLIEPQYEMVHDFFKR